MDADSDHRSIGSWGTVQVEDRGTESFESKLEPGRRETIGRSRLIWSPSPSLDLPAGFNLSLDCLTSQSGVRRVAPNNDAIEFLLQAALAGHAILIRSTGHTPEREFSYGMIRLFFQQAPHFQEHLARSFRRESDLTVERKARADPSQRDVLPHLVHELYSEGDQRLSVGKFLNEGRQAAMEAGHQNPNDEVAIRFGLFEAARAHPIDPATLSRDEAAAVVRLGLFGLGRHAGAISAEIRDRVVARILAAFEKQQDKSPEDFDRWLRKPDNIVHAVAKQKKGGGPIDREIVRGVYADLVFRAHEYVGELSTIALNAVLAALPVPLKSDERAVFEAIYFARPWLGGLSVVMLRDRFPFLREIVLALFADPTNLQVAGSLLRMLEFYGDMSEKRRAADVRAKAGAGHRLVDAGNWQDLHELGESDSTSHSVEFERLVATYRDQIAASCDCRSTSHWTPRVDPTTVDKETILINDGCETCGFAIQYSISRAEFKSLAIDPEAESRDSFPRHA